MGSQLIQPSPRGRDPSKLTDAQRIFCAEYLANGLKGAQAARVAYPNAKNPAAMAEKVLSHPVAKGYLGKLLHNRLEQSGLSAERILKQLETALFLDPLDLFEATGESGVYRVRSLEQVPPEVRQCITELKSRTRTDKEGNTDVWLEIRLMSKDQALELAMKYRNLLEPEQTNINLQLGTIDFDALCAPPPGPDLVETKLLEVRGELQEPGT